MYADDLLIMSRANVNEAVAIQSCFNFYCSWSGQKANVKKSSIMFSKNIERSERKGVLKVMGIKEMKKDSVYLGNCFVFNKNKTKDFNKLKEIITARIES